MTQFKISSQQENRISKIRNTDTSASKVNQTPMLALNHSKIPLQFQLNRENLLSLQNTIGNRAVVQLLGDDLSVSLNQAQNIHQIAAKGVQGIGSKLPHLDKIQKAFGTQDLRQVQAYTNQDAVLATEAIGAQAYTIGNKIAFNNANPDLHTVAHEAAHVVQQRDGVHLKEGIGEAGDLYEQHANAVADRVLQGQSANELLNTYSAHSTDKSSYSVPSLSVQMAPKRKNPFEDEMPLPIGKEGKQEETQARSIGEINELEEGPISSMEIEGSEQAAEKHLVLGAMIKGQDNPIKPSLPNKSWEDLDWKEVFLENTHRGDLSEPYTSSGTFDWPTEQLQNWATNTVNNYFKPENFYIFANVNTYKTPGFTEIPKDYEGKSLKAFGSGWSLDYKLNIFEGGGRARYSKNYDEVLNAWSEFPLVLPHVEEKKHAEKTNQVRRKKNLEDKNQLGEDKAAHVLRYISKRYWQANKNNVIPHRGLRNMVLNKISSEVTASPSLKRGKDYISIIALDDDLEFPTRDTIPNLMKQGEKVANEVIKEGTTTKKGVAFSAPGYIYNKKNNLLEYTASVLSHIAGRVIEDSYPSEPGLTLTYQSSLHDEIQDKFLSKNPWGEENSNIKKLTRYGPQQGNRTQSKEGRAFSYHFSYYMDYRRQNGEGASTPVSSGKFEGAKKPKIPKKTPTANTPPNWQDTIPIRGKDYVSVEMSKVVENQIFKRGYPPDLKTMSEEHIKSWIINYIQNNTYHPAGGHSAGAKRFLKKVIPAVAKIVKSLINNSNISDEDKPSYILNWFIAEEDSSYLELMNGFTEATEATEAMEEPGEAMEET